MKCLTLSSMRGGLVDLNRSKPIPLTPQQGGLSQLRRAMSSSCAETGAGASAVGPEWPHGLMRASSFRTSLSGYHYLVTVFIPSSSSGSGTLHHSGPRCRTSEDDHGDLEDQPRTHCINMGSTSTDERAAAHRSRTQRFPNRGGQTEAPSSGVFCRTQRPAPCHPQRRLQGRTAMKGRREVVQHEVRSSMG